MSPVAAKLLMCTCAGAMGAASVPAFHKARALMQPRPAAHHLVRTAAPAVPCLPFGTGEAISMGAGTLPDVAIDTAQAAAEAGTALSLTARSTPAHGPWSLDGSGAGSAGASPGGNGGVAGPPVASPAPEPETWAMLLIGLGAVGGGVRWQRRPLRR